MTDRSERLPNAEQAIVPREKVVNYLLSNEHPDGGQKATFFNRFGFRPERWYDLRDALLRHACESPVVTQELNTRYGDKYVIAGELCAPEGRAPSVCSVWMIPRSEQAPRFVTAYPG